MSDSTTQLDLLSFSQNAKETTANALFDALSAAALFGRRASTTTGLTWGWYGGDLWLDGVLTTVASSTLALSASNTNYVEATRAGVVSKNTTAFTPGSVPLYTIVTGASSITSYTDHRITNVPITGILSKSVAGSSNVTLTAAEARNNILSLTGALTGNISVIVPNGAQMRTVLNSTTGAYTLTVKTSAGTGIAITQGKSARVYSDGTNVLAGMTDTATLATFSDAAFAIQDNADATKQAQFQLSGLTTGTTRTYTAPNESGTLALLQFAQTWTAAQTFGQPVNITNTTASTSSTTGALTVAGGVGIAEKLYVNADTEISGGGKIRLTGAGTNSQFVKMTTTGAIAAFGVDSSTGSAEITGSSPYSTFIGAFSNVDFYLVQNAIARWTLNAGTLAGTATTASTSSTTGALTVAGGVGIAGSEHIAGNLKLTTAGSGLYVKGGTNATTGRAVLVAGTVTVNNTKVTAASNIILTCQIPGGVVGTPYIASRVNGTSFTITSTNVADTSTYAYWILEET